MNKESRIKNCGKRFKKRLIHNSYSIIRSESGQSLMEIVIALAIGAILIGGASTAIVVVLQSSKTSQIQQSATTLAQETIEKSRIYAMADWSNLYGLSKTSSTKYFFNATSTEIFHIKGVEGVVDGDIRSGLVGHWGLDEATSTTAYDYSANSNVGSVVGAVATSTGNCKVGRCYSFDGANDYILATGVPTSNSVTVSMWVKQTGRPNSNSGLVHGAPSGSTFGGGDTKVIGIWTDDSDGDLWGRFIQSDGTKVNFSSSDGEQLSLDSWHFVIQIADSDAGKCYQYIDGSLVETINYDGTLGDYSDFGIGKQGSESLDGYLDDVRIYNRALSADEVEHLYNSTLFDRYFYVENVCRTNDSNYEIAGVKSGESCDAGEVEDPSTQLVTAVLEWQGKEEESSFSLSEYVTRWRNEVFRQTDWSGGSGQKGPVSESTNKYSSSTNVSDSNLGEIRIEGL